MSIGIVIRKFLHIPGIHMKVNKKFCVNCKRCNTVCSMGLDVAKWFREIILQNLTVVCVDECPKNAIAYGIKEGR